MEFAEWRVKRIQRYLEENPEPPEEEEAPPCEPCCDPALAEISKLQKIVLDPDLGFKKIEPTEAELCERRMARKKREEMKTELCRAERMLSGVRDRYVAYLERTRGPVRGFGTVPSVAGAPAKSFSRKSAVAQSPTKTAMTSVAGSPVQREASPTASRPSYPSPRLSTRSVRTAGKKSSHASGSFRVRSAAPKSTRSKASSSKSGSRSATRSARSAAKSSRRSGSRQPVSTISEEMADELNNIFAEKGFTTPEREELGRRYNSKRTTSSKSSFYSKKIGDYYDTGASVNDQ